LPPPIAPPFDIASSDICHAGFRLRLIAALVDWTLLAVVAYVLISVLRLPDHLLGGDYRETRLLNILVRNSLYWVYFAALESSRLQATLGKRLVEIVVTDACGQRITFARATARHFAKYLSALPAFAGFFMAAFTARKQALHDLIAGCLVIRR